jgi:hypothetical protein
LCPNADHSQHDWDPFGSYAISSLGEVLRQVEDLFPQDISFLEGGPQTLAEWIGTGLVAFQAYAPNNGQSFPCDGEKRSSSFRPKFETFLSRQSFPDLLKSP